MSCLELPKRSDVSITLPIAGQWHLCDQCQKPIPKGVKHLKHVYRENGELFSLRYHCECP